MVKLKVWCAIDEVENEKKVIKALKNLFPSIKFRKEEEKVVGIGKKSDIEFLREKIWWKKILDTVRETLIQNLTNEKTELLLHKQAAFSGKVALVETDEESPFGAIHVEIMGKNLEEFIDWFSPKTKKGKPILKSQ